MSIAIKKLDAPNLPNVGMACDDVIDKKLMQYPMVADVWGKTSFNVITGRMGSGKTSLMISLMKKVFKKCFENIYVVIPENSRDSLSDDIFEKGIKNGGVYSVCDTETLTDIYEKLQENSKEKEHSLLVIDDYGAVLKQKEIVKILQKIITKMRHLRTTVFLLQQNWQQLAKPLRELTSNLITFDLGKSQMQKIFDETINLKPELFDDLMKLCFRNDHDWILISFRSRKIYSKFDLIEFRDDDAMV
jgi:thymidine kinase